MPTSTNEILGAYLSMLPSSLVIDMRRHKMALDCRNLTMKVVNHQIRNRRETSHNSMEKGLALNEWVKVERGRTLFCDPSLMCYHSKGRVDASVPGTDVEFDVGADGGLQEDFRSVEW